MSVQLKPGMIAWVPPAELERDPDQPRKTFDEKVLRELGRTMQNEEGEPTVEHPLIIRMDGKKKIIFDGERRWRAAKLIKMKKLPCLLKQNAGDAIERAAGQLVTSEQREALSTLDIAEFLVDLRKREKKSTNELLAAISKKGIPMDPARVERLIQIAELPAWAKKYMRDGWLTETHAVALLEVIPYPDVAKELKGHIDDETDWKGSLTVKELREAVSNAFYHGGRDLHQSHGPEEHRRIFPIEPCRKCEFYKKHNGRELCLNLAEFDKKQKEAMVLKANKEAEKMARKQVAAKTPGARDNPDPTQVEPVELPTGKGKEQIVVLKGLRNRPHRELAEATFDVAGCVGCPHRHSASHDGKKDGAEDHCFHLPCFEHKTNADKRYLSRKEKLREYLEAWLRPLTIREAPKRLDENSTYALMMWLATGAVENYSKFYHGQMHSKAADNTRQFIERHKLVNLAAFIGAGGLATKLEQLHWHQLIQAAVRTMTREQLRFFAQLIGIEPAAAETQFRIDDAYLNLKRKSELVAIAKAAGVEKLENAGVPALKAALLDQTIVERIAVPQDFSDLYREPFDRPDDPEEELGEGLGDDGEDIDADEGTVCIECGCTHMDPCEGGCAWSVADGNVGVCTECPKGLRRWNNDDRTLTKAAQERVAERREMLGIDTAAVAAELSSTPAKAKRKGSRK